MITLYSINFTNANPCHKHTNIKEFKDKLFNETKFVMIF